jgi:fluoride exporter
VVLQFVYIGIGGFLGAGARYWLQVWCAERWGAGYPYGAMAVNAIGCFAIGFVLTWIGQRLSVPPELRLFVVVGFLGGFTTFSSFAYETYRLAEQGSFTLAFANLALNVVLGMAGVLIGVVLARMLQAGGS